MPSGIRERLSTLTDDQRRLLAQRLAARKRPAAATGIVRQPRGLEPLPLSFAQQRFWFLNQFTALNTAFNISEFHRLTGALDVDALQRALDEIVRRHEVLRTTFDVIDGRPVQRIAPPGRADVTIEDLRSVPADQRQAAVGRRTLEECARPWSLERGPLFRAHVWRVADEEHVLLVLMHHLVADGWSKNVLVREITALYQAFSKGQPSPLAEPPIQYADYAVWQHRWLESEEFGGQMDYWKRQLADLPVLQLPAVRPRAVSPTGGFHRWSVLPRAVTEQLNALGQSEGVTLFMTLLGAFSILLSRYAGSADVVVGSPIANRNRHEVEDLVGCFMNPLPLRTRVDADVTFRQMLRHVREVALGAYANQDVPFDVLVRTLQPGRATNNAPLFQVMFLLHNFSWQSLTLSRNELGTRALTLGEGRWPDGGEFDEEPGDLVYPVALEVIESDGALACCFEYSAELAHLLSRAPVHFRTLVEQIMRAPDTPIRELSMLPPDELTRLVDEWSGRATERTADVPPAHRLFERRVEETPDATALVYGPDRLTYAQLNAAANRLARRLQHAGVGPDVPVGILLPRSIDMIVAALAVMKAGGAYVPLDPTYPVDRLAYILDDASVGVLVTDSSVLEQSPVESRAAAVRTTICLDREAASLGAGPDTNLAASAAPSNLAYLIYTSGSTGRPKGTMVTHANLSNAYLAWERSYGLRAGVSSHLQMASFSFDVFSGDLVRALCSGGKLVVAPHEFLFAPERLYALMRAEAVDFAEFVPAVIRDVVKYLDATGQSLDFLRMLVVGSDAWFAKEYVDLRRFCGPATRLVNSYGVTEATIDSTYFESAELDADADTAVPIGRPFDDVELYLLDRDMQLAPAGAIAELFIGGAGVTRGYLNRPDLTAEKFVPNPFSAEPGARLYRTGDLARYLPDGNVAFLGRGDHQVKLRGFRIELSEIEAVLSAHEAVHEAAVVIREDVPGDRRLVGYVSLNDAAACTAPELRRALRESLPEHMVPSAVVVLASLPLTPNGKVDRRALPAPDGARSVEETYVAPQTELERAIAEVWREVLRVDKVGIHDNFFDLGGHSLLLLQLQSRLQQRQTQPVTVMDLFKYPTVHALASHLAGAATPAAARASEQIDDRAEKQREALRRRQRAAREAKVVAS